jgi:small subunit ribosomal protein S2
MKPYIFGERNGVYILDLKQTLIGLDQAYSFVQDLSAHGGALLFVGTKKQAQEPIATQAARCGMPYVNHRWLGGMLTNFVTIRGRVSYMEELEGMVADGRMDARPKKEQILLRKELGKLQDNLNGIREMKAVPQAIFVVDTHREDIAIREARRLGIPVLGIIDTNSDPDDVDFGIPGNDDAIRSVNLITEVISEAVLAGANKNQVVEEAMLGSAYSTEAAELPVGDAEAVVESVVTADAEAAGDAENAGDAPAAAADVEVDTAEVSAETDTATDTESTED